MNTTFTVQFRNYDTFSCIFNYKIDAEIANWHQFVLRSCYPIAFFPLLHIRNTTELVAVRDSPLDVFTRAKCNMV